MPDITNTSGTPIGLPDGSVIPPKQAAPVENWDDFKDRANLKHYVQHGVLVVAASAGGQPSSSSPSQGASENEEEQQKRDLRGKKDRDQVFHDVRIMEAEALAVMAEQKPE